MTIRSSCRSTPCSLPERQIGHVAANENFAFQFRFERESAGSKDRTCFTDPASDQKSKVLPPVILGPQSAAGPWPEY